MVKELEPIDGVIAEVKSILKNGDDVPAEIARRLLLTLSVANHECNRETVSEVRKINGRLKKVEKVAEGWEKNPSLMWLLRFKTKKTVTVLITSLLVGFLAFQALWYYGLLPILLEWLNLPPLIP